MLFSYKAVDAAGKLVRGRLDAPDEKAAAVRLQESGCIPMQIVPAANGRAAGLPDRSSPFRFLWRDGAGNSGAVEAGFRGPGSGEEIRRRRGSLPGGFFSGVSGKERLQFTRDLSVLLAAGLPVDRALSLLADSVPSLRFRTIIMELLKAVQGGADLSEGMGRHPGAFAGYYVNMIRAGEAGGVLPAVLDRLSAFLETSEELKDDISSALVYPLFLIAAGGISVIILMTFVIPKFGVIFQDMGAAIPLSTRLLLRSAEIFRKWWWLLLLAAGGLGAGLVFLLRRPAWKARADRLKFRLPLFGDLLRKVEAARFSRTMGTLMTSGVPILTALGLVRNIHTNTVVFSAMDRIYDRVREGDPLSAPLAASGVFPPLAVQMIRVGEESGRLDAMLLKVAESYDKMVRRTVKRLAALLEPLLILLMGIGVGFIVISMLMAIFSMNEIPF
ncbi:MAG: type II secretion system protein GspF [Desulfobacterales bacterium]|nr:MAG: type II secretion system protein GspF [Desulfobacterales bacterium]